MELGIGYVLSLLVQEDCNVERIRKEIQVFSADPITLQSMMGLVVRFDVSRNSRFTTLLQHLESNKEELKIISLTLSAASIEGQFLRCKHIYFQRLKFKLKLLLNSWLHLNVKTKCNIFHLYIILLYKIPR